MDQRQVPGGDRGPGSEDQRQSGEFLTAPPVLGSAPNRKSAFQNKARRQQLLLKDDVLDKLEESIQTIIRSLPEDLQHLLSTQSPHRVL